MESILKFACSLPIIGARISGKRDKHQLLQELEDIQYRLTAARNAFDMLTDADLIESCIYQMESLEVKYNFLIKQARGLGLKHSELVCDEERIDYADVRSVEHCGGHGNRHVLVLQKHSKTV
ncbi:hypothetical protein CLOSTMETH_01498 [[Clostridium] methylpentosum DSM 5476]|uniref:DUF2508 family protein n=1 Tax=[Clostridium] methylpentosum DSM 5476 TaxID=537013 RepID=C0ECC9_9FIRM|nr:hypothetical protein CLOSTMETH_01498 [[Clostridium] methylpentosum DSM 5476]MDY3989512.1 DUF2508 family protein [Massilioclostridium sp.]MEE1492977.1 DUF2508 family protein [Massilioclostridium sp.]